MKTTALLRQNPLTLAGKFLRRSTYALRTGYWHTGERCCEGFEDENFRNHFRVYRFASQFCEGKSVLDVGCGTGYGVFHIAQFARSVVGIDVSRQAIRYATLHYRAPNITFIRMNAESLKCGDKSFDFVISSENFEHLHDQRANLREMARVLTDDGMLLLATPNHEMFLDVNNPFHTHELTFEELRDMAQECFGEYLVAETLLDPPTEEGQRIRRDRKRRGSHGINLLLSPFLWGARIDTTWLSNTHSFFCFARFPRRA